MFAVSCKIHQEIFINKTFLPSDEIEFSINVYPDELARLERRFAREGMSFKYKQIYPNVFKVYLTKTHIEKTVKDKNKRSVIPKKFDGRIDKAIRDEIN